MHLPHEDERIPLHEDNLLESDRDHINIDENEHGNHQDRYIVSLIRLNQHENGNGVPSIVTGSMIFNSIEAVTSLMKIVATTMFLILNKQTCELPLRTWLYFMLAHDIFNLFLQYAILSINTIQFGLFRSRNPNPAQQQANANLPNFEQAINMEGNDPISEMQNSLNLMRTGLSPVEARSGFIQGAKLFVWTLYVSLFIWGNILIFFTHSECSKDAKELTVMVMIYIGISYLILCYPLLMLIALCLCLPVLVVISFFLNGDTQRPADERQLTKLNILEFKKEDEKFPESMCCICQCEYETEEKIVLLDCNKNHYFHDECIKDWLRINAVCPICRKRI